MKVLISAFLLSLFMISGHAQELFYSVHGNYKHPITKEKISKARSMSDIILYYPANWIKSYVSVNISANTGGNTKIAGSVNDILSQEQINLLNAAVTGTEIIIDIHYYAQDHTSNQTDIGKMHYSTTVIPENEALFPDGKELLTQYLKENAIDKISSEEIEKLQPAVVRFIINEEGEIANAHLSMTSGNPEVDKLLLETVNKMPNWNPATDSKGQKVKQEFEFTVSGNEGC